jgi:tetratricopeptide (TPR) repeat protein
VLEQAMQRDVSATPLPVVEWIGAFAKIGAFDRATQLVASLPASDHHEAHFRLATAHSDRGQYEPAITLLGTIPDGVLFPLPEYPDPKLELLNRITDETIQQNQFAVAKRAAQVMQAPVDQVRAWIKIATAYQTQQQPTQAIAAFDQALAVAKTIDKVGFHAERHSYYEVSNADLLIAIAEGYWAIGESEKAIATAQLGLQSAQNFEATFSYPGFTINSLEKIGQLGRQWQQPELLRAAIAEINRRTAPDISPELLIDTLTRQVTMAYEPGVALSEESQSAIARLEDLREQAASPEQELAIINHLLYLYNLTQQPALAQTALDRWLVLVEPLSADLRDSHYMQMILAIAKGQTPERVADLLPLLSSPQKQVNALIQLAQQYAAENRLAPAISSFEQAAEIASKNLAERDRNSAIIDLANAYSYFNSAPHSTVPPRTPAEIALMRQIPQYMSDPLVRARIWMNFVPYLPPAAAETAYTDLSSTLTEIPNAYARRELLWQGILEALSYQKNEQATQLANALDGDYRQLALGFVENQQF